jgi:hypothetical protein
MPSLREVGTHNRGRFSACSTFGNVEEILVKRDYLLCVLNVGRG